MLTVKSVNEVFEIIKDNFSNYQLESETISLLETPSLLKIPGRVLDETIIAGENIPAFDKSAVDGYAVIAEDTFGASDAIPAQLVKGPPVQMGESPGSPLSPGTACYIPTGGQLPPGANGVVMVEYSDDYGDEYVYLNKAAAPGAHIIFTGDDIKEGQTLLTRGKKLIPADMGLLCALGITEIKVKRKIKAAIIATGDEIIPIDKKPAGSQVRDINSYVLFAGLAEYAGYSVQPVMYGIQGDDYEQIRLTVSKALSENDLVLISGGSSAGNKDETANIIAGLGEPGVLVHGIAVKPGKPTIIGRIGTKPVLGLPGHPASAFMTFTIFITALLDTMSGENKTGTKMTERPHVEARVMENYPSNNGREEYVPVELIREKEGFCARALLGKSGQISLMARAGGYIHISRDKEGLMAGEKVQVILAPGAAYGL